MRRDEHEAALCVEYVERRKGVRGSGLSLQACRIRKQTIANLDSLGVDEREENLQIMTACTREIKLPARAMLRGVVHGLY
jgi:hypothetical protein